MAGGGWWLSVRFGIGDFDQYVSLFFFFGVSGVILTSREGFRI
jgi:hypothetical protein